MSGRKIVYFCALMLFTAPFRARAQQLPASQGSQQQMPGMDMPSPKPLQSERQSNSQHVHGGMKQKPTTFIATITQHATSGTGAEPNSTPMPMLMTMKRDWM